MNIGHKGILLNISQGERLMLKLITLTLVAGLAAPIAVSAASPGRVTDVEFIQANRCGALMAASDLGEGSASNAAYLKAQRQGRPEMVIEMARKAWEKADKQARTASAERKAHLVAERDGACEAYKG